MSGCLSNLPISNLRMSERANLPHQKYFQSVCSPVSVSISRRIHPTMAASSSSSSSSSSEGRVNNLNHLQRSTKHHQSAPQQPRRTSASVTGPGGMWDRLPAARTVQQMMETMERLMDDDDPFAYSSSSAGNGGGRWWPSQQSTAERYSVRGRGGGGGRRAWEIRENEEEYKMRFDMPGMTKQDVKVWIEDKILVVKAEKIPKNNGKEEGGEGKKEEEEEEEEEWGAESYGRYSNRIALPENVEFEKIKAEVKNGVLYISVPKPSPRTKILDINVQ